MDRRLIARFITVLEIFIIINIGLFVWEKLEKHEEKEIPVIKQEKKEIKQEEFKDIVIKKDKESSTGAIFVFFGDTHWGRGFSYYEKKDSNYRTHTLGDLLKKDGKYQQFLSGANEVIVNLEAAITKKCPPTTKSVTISMTPEDLEVIKNDIKATMINTANNHAYDCGTKSYNTAKLYIKEANLKQFGDGRGDESIVYTGAYNGINYAFFGFEDIETKSNWEEKIKKVKRYGEEGYIPIVNLHWGVEYSNKHTPSQEKLAHRFIDEADTRLIVGHHPHVIADKEIYKGVPIYYSLGNFIFDQPWPETLKGIGIRCYVDEKNSSCEELEFRREKEKYRIMVD